MDKFLETYNLSGLNNEETENPNRLITSKEMQSVIKKSLNKQKPRQDGVTGEFYETFQEKLIPIIFKPFQNGRGEKLPNFFYEASITLILKSAKKATKKEYYRSVSLMSIDEHRCKYPQQNISIDANILNKISAD